MNANPALTGTSGAGAPRRALGLRLIVSVAAALIAAAGVLGAGLVAEHQSRAALSGELRARLLLTARSLALASASALHSDYPELTLHPLIRELQREEPALALAVVVDRLGVIQGHSDARRLGETYASPEEVTPLADAPALRPGETLGEGPTLLLAESPVLHPTGETIGKAVVGMRRGYLTERVQAARHQQILVLGGVLLTSLTLIFGLLSRLLRPARTPRSGIERGGSGKREAPLPAGEPVADVAGALAYLARAEREGRHLALPATPAELAVLHDWVRACPRVKALPMEDQGLVVTAIYEVAANIAEHACAFDPAQRFDLWWVAPATAAPAGLAGGYFLLRDRGRSFRPEARPASDLRDPAARRRGRGLGLDIIRGVGSRFEYFPATSAGNLTLLAFSSSPSPQPKEPIHAW